MNPRHFSPHRAEHHDGPDDPLHATPIDPSGMSPEDLASHEGEPVMFTPELLDAISDPEVVESWAIREAASEWCDRIEQTLEHHYRLAGTGYGIAFDVRDKTARLVKL